MSNPAPQSALICSTLVALALATGCSPLDYELVEPPELARHIGRLTVIVQREPLEYRLTKVSNHLVIRIYNRSAGPITLVGGPSTVVDPDGQSHPLAERVIVPQSYIKLILPPLRPIYGPVGPVLSFGMPPDDFRPGFPYNYGWNTDDPVWYEPPYYPYYTVNDDGEGTYWRWDKGGDVRLMLTWFRGVLMPGHRPAPGIPASGPAAAPTAPATAPLEAPPTENETFTHEFLFRQIKRG